MDKHERMATAVGLSGEEFDRYVHSHRCPGFDSVIKCKLAWEIFGQRIERDARIAFECSPNWTYYDLKKKALFTGWGSTSYTVEVHVRFSDDDGKRRSKWISADVMHEGIWSERLSNLVFDMIEAECAKIDAMRRKKFERV